MTVAAALPRICFVIEVTSGASALARAQRALESEGAATLILAAPPGGNLPAETARPIVAMAQNHGIATLIQDDAHLAKSISADGVHLTWHEEPLASYEAARKILGKDAIVGADAGHSRHDAMELGESGADYVAFSIPPGMAPEIAAHRQLELVEWWAEVFEIPVVGFGVETPDEVERLSSAGADFLAAHIPPDIPEHSITAWANDLATAADHDNPE